VNQKVHSLWSVPFLFYRLNKSYFVMTARVKDILSSLNTLAPFNLAEPWDNVGLLVGNLDQEVTAILAGLDPTIRLIEEAISLGANTVVTHHPVIFKPLPTINTANPDGILLEKALSNRIAIISCHTNFDSAQIGVSAILAQQLGLDNHRPLIPVSHEKFPDSGLGRIGSYLSPKSSAEFLKRVLNILKLDSVQMAGILPKMVTTIAICGGSGSELATQARTLGAEVYLSAEIKHNTAIWAVESNFCIIDGTHYATEKPAVNFLVKQLQLASDTEKWDIRIMETKTERSPFVKIDRNHQQ
jgi:dinuclear metal center YbgI/SA1388 family protein